jgi:hypothetical protein
MKDRDGAPKVERHYGCIDFDSDGATSYSSSIHYGTANERHYYYAPVRKIQ